MVSDAEWDTHEAHSWLTNVDEATYLAAMEVHDVPTLREFVSRTVIPNVDKNAIDYDQLLAWLEDR